MESVGHAPATLVGITRRLSLSTRIPRAVSSYARAPAARDGGPPISGAHGRVRFLIPFIIYNIIYK